ncbi:MAG: hypothetical protein IPH08_05285 [Rhodocyclaceae bacterium]|nr:hypothetical protein [Rhodocyclaceae bacterium]
MLRWFAGETLAHFFNLLSRTADDIWEYRKKFWTAYYQRGAISEAWFALGPIAQALGRQQKLQFGDLSRAAQNQSVLIMKLGSFIVAEWSHSGACRFWNENDRLAPGLYRKVYFADDLRNPVRLTKPTTHPTTGPGSAR